MMAKEQNKGWIVTLAGLGITLAVGVLSAWSLFKATIEVSIKNADGRFDWDLSRLNDPFALCFPMVACNVMLAGRIQDKYGPRLTAIIGGILVSAGLFVCALSYSLSLWLVGMGLLLGTGIGFSFASATPPAIKWFPPSKTGLIIGIVVTGSGLAPVYVAPLGNYLINRFDLSTTLMFFACADLIIICGLGALLVNPPAGYAPKDVVISTAASVREEKSVNFTLNEALNTVPLYILAALLGINAGIGLMIISNVTDMTQQALGNWAGLAFIAVGSASGRIISGVVSDKVGRTQTLALFMGLQAITMFSFWGITEDNHTAFILVAVVSQGVCYGANFSLFPAVTKSFFGLKNFGAIYGIVYLGVGVGGFILPKLSQFIKVTTGSYDLVYILAGVLSIINVAVTLMVKGPNLVP